MDDRPQLLRIPAVWALAVIALAIVWWVSPGREEPVDGRSQREPGDPGEAPTLVVEGASKVDREPVGEPARPTVGGATGDVIVVRVVTADDTPMSGVKVGLRRRVPGVGGSDQPLGAATSDSDGFTRIGWDAEKLARLRQLGVDLRFRVQAIVALPEPPRVELGTTLEGHGVVRLVVPRSGSVRVDVDAPDGRAVTSARCEVFLFWRDRELAGTDARFGRTGIPRAMVEDGVAVFPVVPLGKELSFNVSGGKRYAPGTAKVMGPLRPGEQVEVRIRLPAEKPIVTGIVVDEKGRVRANTKLGVGVVRVDVKSEPGTWPERSSTLWHTTDAEGRFHHPFWAPRVAGQRRVFLIEQDDYWTDERGSGVKRRAVVDLEFDLTLGEENDLGTVLISGRQPATVLVGKVVDAAGEPVRGAHVSAGWYDDESGRTWRSLSRARVQSAADGSFTIMTDVESPELVIVSATKLGMIHASAEVALGSRDVVLTLRDGATLDMTVTVDDAVPKHLLSARLTRRGGGFQSDQELAFGGVRWRSLPEGVYDLVVHTHKGPWQIAQVDGVTVPAGGGRADDARLRDIDLRRRCRVWRVRVKAVSGEPVAKAWLQTGEVGGRSFSVRTDLDGWLLLVTPTSVGSLRLGTDAADAVDIAWRENEQTVQLGR